MNEFVTGLLTKFFNKSDEEVAELFFTKSDEDDELKLKEDALDLAYNMDAERVKNIKASSKEDTQKYFDNGYSKGKKETFEDVEKQFSEITGFSSEKEKFEEKLTDFMESISKKEPKSKLTDDDVKKHPLYRELESSIKNKYILREDHEKIAFEYEDFKKNVEKNMAFDAVKRDIQKIFKGLGAIEPEDANVATNRYNDFVEKFKNYEYEVAADGNHFILKDGKRLEDEHNHPVTFQSFVESNAKQYYEIKKQDSKGTAGNKNGEPEGAVVFKDKEDWKNRLYELNTPEDRVKHVKAGQAAGFVDSDGNIIE